MEEDFGKLLESIGGQREYRRPPKDSVCVKEVVELFVWDTVSSIQREEETPKFNIIFSDDAINYFYEVAQNPFHSKKGWTPNIEEKHIKNLYRENQCDPNCLTIIVRDYKLFFELLTDIINEQVTLNYNYGRNDNARNIASTLMRRIWLRMGVDDVENIEYFLKKQLDFLRSMQFDAPGKEICFKYLDENKITYIVEKCETWCETTRRIHFKIHDGNEYHDLPKIYYDIREENNEKVCYIYAVQMGENRHRIKAIERKLYKLNKGFENVEVHPNFVMAMSLFYKLLCSHEIMHIKVPVLQVLSYRYHALLSEKQKKSFEEKWNQEKLNYLNSLKDSTWWFYKKQYEELLEQYEIDKILYNKFVDKEDLISKNKTEGLINLFMHMTCLDGMSEISTIPFMDDCYLDITLNRNNDLGIKR